MSKIVMKIAKFEFFDQVNPIFKPISDVVKSLEKDMRSFYDKFLDKFEFKKE